MESFLKDLNHSLRSLRWSPAFTVPALALGIGANTAIFSVVNAVLVKPALFPDPDCLVVFMNAPPRGSNRAEGIQKKWTRYFSAAILVPPFNLW